MASFFFNGLAHELAAVYEDSGLLSAQARKLGEDRLRQMALTWMAEVDARRKLQDEFLAAGRAAADRLQEMLRAGPLFPPGFQFYEDGDEGAAAHPLRFTAEQEDEQGAEQASVISSVPPPPPVDDDGSLEGWPEIEIDLSGNALPAAAPAPLPADPLLVALGLQDELAAEAALPPPEEPAPEESAAAEDATVRLHRTRVLRISPNLEQIVGELRNGTRRPEKLARRFLRQMALQGVLV
jgi:hypothetical protein